MSDITKIAEQLNLKVTQLNNERSRQMGMQEAAKTQYDKAVGLYETKYGVKLTPENLQQEYNTIYAELKTNMEVLKNTIEGIERGDYKETTIPNIDLEPEVEISLVEEKPVVQEVVQEVVQATVVSEQKPQVTFEQIVEEKDEPVFGGFDFGGEALATETKIDEPIFGGFNFGGEEVKAEPKVEEPIFGGFNFGGEEVKAEPKVEEPVFGGFNFGGEEVRVEPKEEEPVFGGFDLSAAIGGQEGKAPITNKQVSTKPQIPTDFVQPAPPKFDNGGEEDLEEEESFSPEGWGTPKTNADINKSFADILGSQGLKFGE